MSKVVDFIVRLGEDIYTAKRCQVGTMFGSCPCMTQDTTDVEPATSIESISK